MKETTVKMSHHCGFWLQSTVTLDGVRVVEMRPDNGHDDGVLMLPHEARRLARHLKKWADHVDLKSRAPKKGRK